MRFVALFARPESVEQCSQLLPHTSFRRPRLADRAQEVHMPIAAGSSSVNAVAAPNPCIRHPLLPHLMPAVSTPSRTLAKTKRYLVERWTSTLSPTSGTSARSSIAQNAPPFTAVPKQRYAPEKGWIHALKSGLLQPQSARSRARAIPEGASAHTLAGLRVGSDKLYQPRPPNLQAFSAVEGGGAAQTFGFDF